MKLISKAIIVALGALALTACSFEIVPPATKGKILTTQGYSPDILEPGKYTLWGRDSMVILETQTNTYKETVKVIMSDKLTLFADVRFRGRIAGKDKIINAMFNDISAGNDRVVSFNEVYSIYGKPAVRNKTREILSQYTVEDVHKNYARLSGEIAAVLLPALANTPLEISEVALGDIKYPEVVTAAIEAAKKKELEITEEEAKAEIAMTKKRNELALAQANYDIEITEAKAVRDANKIIAQGITPSLLRLKQIEVNRILAEQAGEGDQIFIPVEGMTSTGASVKMMR